MSNESGAQLSELRDRAQLNIGQLNRAMAAMENCFIENLTPRADLET